MDPASAQNSYRTWTPWSGRGVLLSFAASNCTRTASTALSSGLGTRRGAGTFCGFSDSKSPLETTHCSLLGEEGSALLANDFPTDARLMQVLLRMQAWLCVIHVSMMRLSCPPEKRAAKGVSVTNQGGLLTWIGANRPNRRRSNACRYIMESRCCTEAASMRHRGLQ